MTSEIQAALERCNAAWEAHPEATWGWCWHAIGPGAEIDNLQSPWTLRTSQIVVGSPEEEKVTRLDNFRPVIGSLPKEVVDAWNTVEAVARNWDAFDKAIVAYLETVRAHAAEITALHNKEVPNHTWNGNSIFKTKE